MDGEDRIVTDETQQTDVTATWARLNAIGCELRALSDGASTHILRRDAGRLNREYEERSAALRRELADLQAKLPKTGAASGQRLVMSRALGTIYLRDFEPEPEVHVPRDEWDWSEP
jgi:hypothetical protein